MGLAARRGDLFLLWIGWFSYARVAVWEVAPVARFEVGGAPHPLQVLRAGRVSTMRVALGDRVRKGDILLELDSAEARLRRDEVVARLDAARQDLRFIDAELTALRDEQQAGDRVNESRRICCCSTRASARLTRRRLSKPCISC